MKLCFACWDRMQDGTVVSSSEWREDVAIAFVHEEPQVRGAGSKLEHAMLN
jgi:hypothetical protein